MTRYLCQTVAVTIIACCAVDAAAQPAEVRTAPVMYELVLRDGSRVYGTVTHESPDAVVLTTVSGVTVTAQRTQIVALEPITGRIVNDEFQRADPNTTRLFFAPTGRALEKGKAYLGVYQVFVPSFQVGVTNRFSLGGGTPLLFFGEDDWDRPFWITPKMQVFDSGRVQVAAGAFHAFDTSGAGGGIAYAVATAGTITGSISGGGGVAYAIDGGRTFIAMLGGDRQVARNIKVITENYVWKNGDGMLSFGFRFFGEQLSADLGVAVPLGAESVYAFPVVNFVYSF